MALSFLPRNAFPPPAPLTSTLVALGLDSEAAETISKVYLSAAFTLKEKWEAEYIGACYALLVASDDRGYSSKELRAKLLAVSITRYGQALSEWMKEVTQKAEASVLRRRRSTIQHKEKSTITALSLSGSSRRNSGPQSKKESATAKPILSSTTSPPHAFPRSYPPQVRPEPISFVTHLPLLARSGCEPRTISDEDLDACIDALSQLSLGPSSPQSKSSHKPSKIVSKSRSRTYTTSNPKLTSQLSPSRPRLVSPILDTSVAVSHKLLPKHAPSYPSPPTISRTHNIDIPRSDRRRVCSIPYRRPTIQPSTSPESLPSSLSRGIHRTPSLVSDHGSEASSPSTPPDFPFIPIPSPTFARKGFFPEVTSPLEHSPTRYSVWHDIDFGTDLYG